MIFLMDAQGEIKAVSPSTVNLGSINANEIIVIAPFYGALLMNVKLPNGLALEPIEFSFPEELDTVAGAVYVYRRALTKPLTGIPGNLSVQFFLAPEGEQGTLTSPLVTITINRGNSYFGENYDDSDTSDIAYFTRLKLAAEQAQNKANAAKVNAENACGAAEKACGAAEKACGAAETACGAAETARNEAEKQNNAATEAARVAKEAADRVDEKLEQAVGNVKERLATKLDHNGAKWGVNGLSFPEGKSLIFTRTEEVEKDGEMLTKFTEVIYDESGITVTTDFDREYTTETYSFSKVIPNSGEDADLDAIVRVGLLAEVLESQNSEYYSTFAMKGDVANVYRFKGSVLDYSLLPENAKEGDVYNVASVWTNSAGKTYPSGTNFAATFDTEGNLVWDALGGIEDLSNFFTKEEVKAIVATKITAPNYPSLDSVIAHSAEGNILAVAIDAGNGIALVKGESPRLVVSPATRAIIDQRSSSTKPLVPRELDYSIKVGLTTNTLPLTNEEKQKAQNWIGVGDHEKRIENLEGTLLTFVEDTSSAYEKLVPVGVAPNAILDLIGGASVPSDNLLDPYKFEDSASGYGDEIKVQSDGGIEFSYYGTNTMVERLASIHLNAGTYVFSTSFVSETLDTAACYFRIIEGDYSYNSVSITLDSAQEVPILLVVEGMPNVSHIASIYIMLKKGEAPEPFKPYYEGLRHAPVAEVKSYGSNRFNPQWLIDNVNSLDANKITSFGNGLKVSAYPARTNITFAKFLELTGLKVGDTFSTYSKMVRADGTAVTGTANITFEDGGDGTWLDTISHVKKTITITEDMLKYQSFNIYVVSTTVDNPVYITDIVVVNGDALVDYEPYSAEPIDTYTIPTQIQSIEGFGKEGFVLDFDTKTATYNGKVTDVLADLTEYGEFKTLKVQGGGTLVFENTHKIAVPSTLTYVKGKE